MFNIELVERGADTQNHPADYFSVCWVFCFFFFFWRNLDKKKPKRSPFKWDLKATFPNI